MAVNRYQDVKLFDKLKPYVTHKMPEVVCLCGSARFTDAWRKAIYEESLAGRIVLSMSFLPGDTIHGEPISCTPEQKNQLDQLHFRRIDLADTILVLNVDGYIGESTSNEIAYALLKSKNIRFLEPELNFVDAGHYAARHFLL